MDTPQETMEGGEVSSAFRIEQLFGSRTRARLLGLFLENAERPFYVRELARRVDAQINAVRRELKNLLDIGIVIEAESNAPTPVMERGEEEDGGKEHKRFYQANISFPLFEDLKAVMKKAAVLMNASLVDSLKANGKLDLLILTGRFTETHNIPTDVLVVGELTPEAVQLAIAAFEREIGREVNYTFMPPQEFAYRSDVSDRFLQSILQSRRVVLVDQTGRDV